ncbi:hypothetical protein CY34DRAFT_805811 [Suillus luteus UH-Slu-Lm8-n1]|uniref:Uncharacterized protein n=1 Tax=Suillus luteus UH-Slu-Lm8-n1 TaxID=930992 RepID=A0A0D0AIE6_9AGAM|nr:hypothetical protein CY34DRAFT_805811 [Suillus luteus UH-Slu-Lm8-n1]
MSGRGAVGDSILDAHLRITLSTHPSWRRLTSIQPKKTRGTSGVDKNITVQRILVSQVSFVPLRLVNTAQKQYQQVPPNWWVEGGT